jgi:hypothetical protein
LLAFVAFATASQIANASERFKICESCVSYSEFTRVAVAGGTLNNDIVKVLNPRTGEIRKFKVSFENEPLVGVITYSDPLPVSSVEYQYAQQAKQGLEGIYNFFDTSKNVPHSLSSSALDIIGNTAKINDISMYYNRTITSGQVWGLYWGAIASLGGTLVQVNIVVDVFFSDGSKAVLRLSALNTPSSGQVFILDLLEIWDNQGNNVPINKAQFDQRAADIYAAASAEAMSKLLNVAGRHGILTLNFSRESFGGGGQVIVTDCVTPDVCKIKPK